MSSPTHSHMPSPARSAAHQASSANTTSFNSYASYPLGHKAQGLIDAWLVLAKKTTDSSALHVLAQQSSDAILACYRAHPYDLIRHLEWPDTTSPNMQLALLRSCALWLHVTDRLHYQHVLQYEGLVVLLMTPTAFLNSPAHIVLDTQQLVKARQRWRFASYASALQWRRHYDISQASQAQRAKPTLPSAWHALYDMSYQSRQQSLHQLHPLSALLQWCWALAISMTPQWQQSNGQHPIDPPRLNLKQRLDKLWFEAISPTDNLLLQQVQQLWELQPPPLSFGVLMTNDDLKAAGRSNELRHHNQGEFSRTTDPSLDSEQDQLLTANAQTATSDDQPQWAVFTPHQPWLLSPPSTLSPSNAQGTHRLTTATIAAATFAWQSAPSDYQAQVLARLAQTKSATLASTPAWSLSNVLAICRQSSIKKQVESLQNAPSVAEYICQHATVLLQAEPAITDVRHAIVGIGQDQLPAILIEAWLDKQLYQERKPALELLLPWFKTFAFIVLQLQPNHSSNTSPPSLDGSQCRQLSLLLLQQILQHRCWNERPAMQAWLLANKMLQQHELWQPIQQQAAALHFPKPWLQTLLDMANGRSSAAEHNADMAWHSLNLALDILRGLWLGNVQDCAIAYQHYRSREPALSLRWSDFLQEILLHSDVCCRIGVDL